MSTIPNFTKQSHALAGNHPGWPTWRALRERLFARRAPAVPGATRHNQRFFDLEAQVAALHRVQAVIEFSMDGTILVANENFLTTFGYTLQDIQGRHHAMFVDPDHARSAAYRQFWEKLASGAFDAGEYCRIGKDGREVWIQASYNPVFDSAGAPCKVVKFATDITAQKFLAADFAGQLTAINKSQAVIEFDLKGNILSANDNFLATMGYTLQEIRGRHHSMFADAGHVASADYARFWEKLARGEHDAGQYRRIGKNGREVWIQASYNPIHDMNGRPFKVVKYAADVSQQVRASLALDAAVAQTRQAVRAVQEGDLSQRLASDGSGSEIDTLCRGINALVDTMAGIIERIRVVADAVASSAGELADGNEDLSQRTEQQAAALEETAVSLQGLTATVLQTAGSAGSASELASTAASVAGQGGRAVDEVVATMARISTSSREVGEITHVIEGIAFQTNILALNAAVEAARAGEHGRGFAVVASEIRTLSQRSADAAKQIKQLIDTAVASVGEGTRQAQAAGTTMADIVRNVQQVSELITGISASTREQSASIAQINQAVGHIDGSTQQNAALVEEASAAARSLESQAATLLATVAAFQR